MNLVHPSCFSSIRCGTSARLTPPNGDVFCLRIVHFFLSRGDFAPSDLERLFGHACSGLLPSPASSSLPRRQSASHRPRPLRKPNSSISIFLPNDDLRSFSGDDLDRSSRLLTCRAALDRCLLYHIVHQPRLLPFRRRSDEVWNPHGPRTQTPSSCSSRGEWACCCVRARGFPHGSSELLPRWIPTGVSETLPRSRTKIERHHDQPKCLPLDHELAPQVHRISGSGPLVCAGSKSAGSSCTRTFCVAALCFFSFA
jgi:hypothetical protein